MNDYNSHLNHDFFRRSINEGIKMGLSSIKSVLAAFLNPQKEYQTIHIAGTNGKGSTARILSTCLYNSGLKTGLFTSPHILKVNERLQINNIPIKTKVFKLILNDIENTFLNLKKKNNKLSLTYFEICTIAAFLWFKREKVDIAVIETGMGGRLDSTNCIYSPYVIITGIAKDHEKYLGNKLNDIAQEKAAIIHKKSKVILAPLNDEVKSTIISSKPNNTFYVYSNVLKDKNSFFCKKLKPNFYEYKSFGFLNNTVFNLSLIGDFQGNNAASALKAIELIKPEKLSKDIIIASMKKISWKGRMHIVKTSPLIVFDAAHNVDALKVLKNEFIKEKQKKITCIAGFCEDKNYKLAIKILASFAEKVYLVRLKNSRSFNPYKTALFMRNCNVKNVDYAESFSEIFNSLRNDNKNILVCGSFYLLNEAYSFIDSFGV